jgi:hypothetical protein
VLASRVLLRRLVPVVVGLSAVAACGSPSRPVVGPVAAPAATSSAAGSAAAPDRTPAPALPSAGTVAAAKPKPKPPARSAAPAPGRPAPAPAPAPGRAPGGVDTSRPDRTVGTGSAASCTSAAVVAAVAAGGVIRFDCGPAPVTIPMAATAKIVNKNPRTVLDGGGTVTLSGGGQRRILYQNTCDAEQGYTTSHCQDQADPKLVLQNIGFADGNSTGDATEGGGGGAVFVRGGGLSVVNARFTGNRCDSTGPDLGGAALRVLSTPQPVTVSGSTFTGGVCSNGGAISSIGVSWRISGSTFTGNRAIGKGANPAKAGTPGGGSGGAIYLDGNTFTLSISGSRVTDNSANEGGGAVFFVSNDRTGTATVSGSTFARNPSAGFETEGLPGWFFLGARPPSIS